MLDFIFYKIQRAMLIHFYLLGFTYKEDRKIKYLMDHGKLFKLFFFLKRDKQLLQRNLYRRSLNTDFRYISGISEKNKILIETDELKLKRLPKGKKSSLEDIWENIGKKIKRKKKFKKQNINWALKRNKLNTLFSNKLYIKKWNKKRGNFFKWKNRKLY